MTICFLLMVILVVYGYWNVLEKLWINEILFPLPPEKLFEIVFKIEFLIVLKKKKKKTRVSL